jgi:cytochrome c1
MATQFNPPPRHLGCVNIASITDGQVYWIIRNGSAGTEMPAHKNFTDKEVWQLVAYLRALRFGV